MSEITLEQWKQAHQMHAQLMDLTVTDALQQLQQSQVDDTIKGLVLQLISSGNQSSQFFQQDIQAQIRAGMGTNDVPEVGDRLGEYELLESLGHGGMATVFKAQRVGVESQKPVAIKVFNHPSAGHLLADRFAAEQEILSGLSHPNIVNMHHGGSSEAGVPYIVMELIEQATDIDVYANQQQASLRKKIRWLLQAARAIAYAHNNLIVHRDIKPSNLLIDDRGQLKVVDFGIAKLMSKQDAPQKTTIMALTPSFAAPEQINSGQISVTTDVFSLAVVGLNLITGEPPLPADRLLKSCAEDETTIWQTLKTHVPDKDLRNILNQALQQEPQKRYRNMELLADDLSAWLGNKPVQASPDSWWYRLRKFARRRRALFAALSSIVLMLLAGISVLAWQVEKTRVEAIKAKEVKNFMLGVFSVTNPDDALGEKILAKDLLSQALAEIKARDFEDSSTQVELLNALGQAQFQLGLSERASESFAQSMVIDPDSITANLGLLNTLLAKGDFAAVKLQAAQLAEKIEPETLEHAELLMVQSRVSIHEGQFDLANQQVMKSQNTFEQLNDFKGFLSAGRIVANIKYMQSKSTEAAEYLESLLQQAGDVLAPTTTVILAMKNDLVELYNDVGEYDRAMAHSKQLIDQIKQVLGEDHPFLIQAYISRAGTGRSTGQIKAAKADAQLALEMAQEVYGNHHETTARAMNLVAVMHYVNGDIELALDIMKEASGLFDQVLGEDHPESWDTKTNLTALLNMVKRFDEAIAIIEPMSNRQADVLGMGHKSTIYSQTILARLYGDVGRLDEAQDLGESVLHEANKNFGMNHPLSIGAHFTLAQIYQKKGLTEQAIELLESVVNSEGWDNNNERVISAYNTMGDLYLDHGDALTATEYKERSLQVAIDLLTTASPRAQAQMLKNAEFYWTIGEQVRAQELLNQVSTLVVNEAENSPVVVKLQALQSQFEGQP